MRRAGPRLSDRLWGQNRGQRWIGGPDRIAVAAGSSSRSASVPAVRGSFSLAIEKGRAVSTNSVGDVLTALKLPRDFEYTDASRNRLLYIHRRNGEADIYFVSNQRPDCIDVDCTFRVEGKTPELWHPDTGLIEPAPLWRQKDGRTIVHLRFDPTGSTFVVFRAPPRRRTRSSRSPHPSRTRKRRRSA